MDSQAGFCVKCKERRPMAEAASITLKNGREAIRGRCPQCGTGMYRILPKTL
jgi:RNase P subunit RPR2